MKKTALTALACAAILAPATTRADNRASCDAPWNDCQALLAPYPAAAEPGEEPAVKKYDKASSDYQGLNPKSKRWLHGFRVGTVYLANFDEPRDGVDGGTSLKEEYDLESPWMFAIGYEGMRRIVGHSWLNVILVGNVTVLGLEQSKFIPSGNALIGFEFDESFQAGVGVNVTPEEGKELHMIAAVGWTPKIGDFFMPVHLTFVPDVDGTHRIGTTIGVNW